MFVLWYTTLSWKEYRHISSGVNSKAQTNSKQIPEQTNIKPNSVSHKSNTNDTIKLEIPEIQQNNLVPSNQNNLNKKPIRQHSPHPVLKPNYNVEHKDTNSHVEEEEMVEEEEEEEEEEEDVEEEEEDEDVEEGDENEYSEDEEENSVVEHLNPNKIPSKDFRNVSTKQNMVNDFLKQEIKNQQNNIGNITRKSETMVDAAVLEKLETGFKNLQASDSKSLLKKYLTKEVFDNLKTKKTSFGSTLLDVVQSGFENHDSGVGLYAPDAEAYTVFADLFDPVIEDYHFGFKKTDKHPPKNWGDVSSFGNLDPNNEFVVSTRVRCGRSMEGYPFNPCLTEEQYKEMEGKVSSTLSGLEGELKGTFYPLTGMSKDVQQKLIDDHFLFKEGDRFLQAANACRYWPSGRGIYHNDKKTFLVWCNEEDHLRLISMQMGGDLGEVYRRLVTAVNDIEKRIPFSHNDRLGFLTFCPTNLGTTVRSSVHIKVPKLAANKAQLEEVAAKYNLQVRGTRGEHTEAEGGVYDISNKRRMGLTEYDAVKEMYDGIAEIIKIEKEL